MENLINTNQNDKSHFKKLSRNVFSCILTFSSYAEIPKLMMVNKHFEDNLKYFVNKNFMDFYLKHIFLFSKNCITMLKIYIQPFIKSAEGLIQLFSNESLIIKKFIFNLEEEMINDLNLTKNKICDINKENEKIRNYIIKYISKLICINFEKNDIYEIYLNKSNIGYEGSQIMSEVIRKCKSLEYVDFSYSRFTDEDLKIIIKAIEKLDVKFCVNFKGTTINLNNLKYIKILQSSELYKEFIIGDNELCNKSKITAENNKRKGKIEKCCRKFIDYMPQI